MQEHLPLWNKIQSFSIDNGTAAVPFSAKLAASQNWSIEFTQRAIEEYKKFIFLCCIAEKGASPSKIVDEVWHLHLTYTQSYWRDFCRNTLGKDIHHHPSTGGDQEDHKHQEWYRETLQLYRTIFNADPPSDIWPPPPPEWPVPEDPHFHFDPVVIAALVGILSIPFLIAGGMFGTFSPFALDGPRFLWFFIAYGSMTIIAFMVLRWEVRKRIEEQVDTYFPNDVTAFQMAAFLYGKHRALQAGILDLVNRDLLEVTSENSFRVKKTHYKADLQETNPLMAAYAEAPDWKVYTYEMMMIDWYDRDKFSHPGLEALLTFAKRREPFLRLYPFQIAFYGVFIARCIQGMMHNRPITYLLIEAIVLSILFILAMQQFSKRAFVYRKLNRLFKDHRRLPVSVDEKVLKQFALEGFPAINGSTEGLLLAGIFAAYTPVRLHDTLNEWNKSTGWSSGNSSSDSSCGGGGSCSGGSCGGGGGCGGCGGGGD